MLVVVLTFALAGCSTANDGGAGGSSAVHSKTALAVSATQRDARSYIHRLGGDARTLGASVSAVVVAVGLARQSSQVDVNEVAMLAQQAHDTLDGIRQDFADTTTTDGSLGAAELEVFAAANDLKNSMGALVAYTGSPDPASLARFAVGFRDARGRWNDGVVAIWRAAGRSGAPTIG